MIDFVKFLNRQSEKYFDKKTNPLQIRRFLLTDILIEDEIIFRDQHEVDRLLELYLLYYDLKSASLESANYESVYKAKNELRKIEKEIIPYIEDASFKSGNLFALTNDQIVVYTNSDKFLEFLRL